MRRPSLCHHAKFHICQELYICVHEHRWTDYSYNRDQRVLNILTGLHSNRMFATLNKKILHSSLASKLSSRHDLINIRIAALRRLRTKPEVCPIAIFPALLQRNLLGSPPAADPAGERNE